MAKKVRKTLYILAILMASGLLIISVIGVDCALRDTLIPYVPIYPGSTLMKEPIVGGSASDGDVQYDYETSDSPEQVGKFYSERAGCTIVTEYSHNMGCYAKIIPFGVYFVQIDYESKPKTTFVVNVDWDKCDFNDFWDNISVES